MKYLTQQKSKFPLLVLASASRCRAEILNQMKIPHIVFPSHIEEKSNKTRPSDIVCDLAVQKTKAGLISYLKSHSNNLQQNPALCKDNTSSYFLVLGADTMIWCNNKQYGKPKSQQKAVDMLRRLSGKKHSVYTGMCLIKYEVPQNAKTSADTYLNLKNHKSISITKKTKVYFNNISDPELSAYIKSGQWKNVSGAYQIQGLGACFIKKIKGLHSTVMGLPITSLYHSINAIIDL